MSSLVPEGVAFKIVVGWGVLFLAVVLCMYVECTCPEKEIPYANAIAQCTEGKVFPVGGSDDSISPDTSYNNFTDDEEAARFYSETRCGD